VRQRQPSFFFFSLILLNWVAGKGGRLEGRERDPLQLVMFFTAFFVWPDVYQLMIKLFFERWEGRTRVSRNYDAVVPLRIAR
jgi:hypothetical protein